jgi:hypothetical protein
MDARETIHDALPPVMKHLPGSRQLPSDVGSGDTAEKRQGMLF